MRIQRLAVTLGVVLFVSLAAPALADDPPDFVNDRIGLKMTPAGVTTLHVEGLLDEDWPELARFKKLERLVVRGPVSDEALRWIANVPVRALVLADTSGVGAKGIAHLTSNARLATLDLTRTSRLTEDRAAALASLRLTELTLDETPLTDEGLAHLASLTSLVRLSLAATLVTDAGLASLAPLASLTTLDVSQCAITATGLGHLAHVTSLTTLDARVKDGVTDFGVAKLSDVKGLRSLRLAGSDRLTDKGIALLASVRSLEELHLVGCPRLTDQFAPSLAPLAHLRVLTLRECPRLSLNVIDFLHALPSLRRFETDFFDDAMKRRFRRALRRCAYGDGEPLDRRPADWKRPTPAPGEPHEFHGASDLAAIPSDATAVTVMDSGVPDLGALARLPLLRSVSFAGDELTLDDLAELRNLPKVESLDLSDQKRVLNGDGLARVAPLTSLVALRLAGGEDLKNAHLARVARLAHLRALDLSSCPGLTDAGVAALSSLTALESISFRGCYRIGDRAVEALAALPELATLDMSVTRVSDDGLAALGRSPRLKTLILQGTSLSDDAVPHLSKLSGLGLLDLRQCHRVSAAAVESLRKALPGCKVIGPRDRPEER